MPHNVKSDAIDYLIDVIKGSDIMLGGTTVADRIVEMADMLAAGTLTLDDCVTVDTTITEGGTNPVTGGAIYTALKDIPGLLIATDSMTQQVLTTMGYESTLIAAPSQALMAYIDNPSVRLCWMRGGMLEIASAVVSIELDTSTVNVYATGTRSHVLGIIGADEWTIEANA